MRIDEKRCTAIWPTVNKIGTHGKTTRENRVNSVCEQGLRLTFVLQAQQDNKNQLFWRTPHANAIVSCDCELSNKKPDITNTNRMVWFEPVHFNAQLYASERKIRVRMKGHSPSELLFYCQRHKAWSDRIYSWQLNNASNRQAMWILFTPITNRISLSWFSAACLSSARLCA